MSTLIQSLHAFIGAATGFIWYKVVFWLSLLSGLYFTLRFLFIQFRCIPHALGLVAGKYDNPEEHGQITHFQALSAALSGTIGLGNIAGVAIAISIGGPGAVFWMWIIGILGMATKFVECTLGTHYRTENKETGEVRGGPMYYITKGLGKQWKPLATFFSIMIIFAGFGAGCMFQTNQAASALVKYYGVQPWITGFVLFILGTIVIIGGIERIGKVASKIVPLMCFIYVAGSIFICILNLDKLHHAFYLILEDAFTGRAAGGGILFTAVMGIRRAIFSNEAGLGSASIAHAAVKTNYPIREGFVAALGPLVDTVLVCTSTALVIILSGNFGSEMYQKITDQEINFEQSSQAILSGQWQMNKTSTYRSDYQFQKVRSGQKALCYQGSVKGNETAYLKSFTIDIQNVPDGIRFSYLRNKGSVDLKIVDSMERSLGRVNLLPNKEIQQVGWGPLSIKQSVIKDKVIAHSSDLTEDITLFTLKGLSESEGKWVSSVLLFSDALKTRIKSNPSLRQLQLQLIPTTQTEVDWKFDRFQQVTSLEGIQLTIASFDVFFKGFGSLFITLSVFFFAFSTMVTWSYYGETAAGYVFGERIIFPYKWVFVTLAFIGAISSLGVILDFSDAMLGLAIIPNLIALFLLSGKVSQWTKTYFRKLKTGKIQPTKA